MDSMLELITAELRAFLEQKGRPVPVLTADTRFLDGELVFDSLDLAVLLLALEEKTGKDPFREGFRTFTTVGELAGLYSA